MNKFSVFNIDLEPGTQFVVARDDADLVSHTQEVELSSLNGAVKVVVGGHLEKRSHSFSGRFLVPVEIFGCEFYLELFVR